MRTCVDCGLEIKYGEADASGSSLHARCRGLRAARAKKELAALRGTPWVAKKHKGAWRQEERGGK
jgi:hypothetical protein